MGVVFCWNLPRDSTAPGQGRWHVREAAANHIEAVDAELVVSELITNAWKHGRGTDPISLRIEVREEGLHLEVCGASDGEPVRAAGDSGSATGESATSGRGLLLIDGLAERWGYERTGDVLCVWADIPRRR